MSVQVSIFDVTEDMLPARRPYVPRTADEERLCGWLAAGLLAPAAHPRPARPAQPTRRCSRCGIDTTAPALCMDCEEVGW